MRVRRFFLCLVLIVVASPLYAQTGGTGSTGSGSGGSGSTAGASGSSSFESVENASEQITSSGGFVGGGRPSSFAGIDEIYGASSAAARSSANSSSRAAASTRGSASRSVASRRTASQAGGARSTMSRSNSGQYVRATASIDFEVPRIPFTERQTTGTIESNLRRMQGIQSGQVTFRTSQADTTAVLRGTVASERDRRVAQQLLLLEPGISRVENLLEVVPGQR